VYSIAETHNNLFFLLVVYIMSSSFFPTSAQGKLYQEKQPNCLILRNWKEFNIKSLYGG